MKLNKTSSFHLLATRATTEEVPGTVLNTVFAVHFGDCAI